MQNQEKENKMGRSRVLKFRAWDKENNKMVSVISFHNFDDEQYECMQFTGLLDKNGREIYEGDIVKITPDTNQKMGNQPHHEGLLFGDLGEVRWNETNLRWSIFPKGEFEEADMDYYGAWSDWNWLEVIGNVYENSELLNG